MEPAATSRLVLPVNYDNEWSTPGGLQVRVHNVHTRFDSFQVVDRDDCADLDAEWLDFARDHPDCADGLGVFLEPCFETFQRLDDGPSGGYAPKQLSLAGYKPESVSVKVRDGAVFVTASESDKTCVVDSGAVKSWKKIERKFRLPDGVPPDAVVTEFTLDGRLTISVMPPGEVRSVAGDGSTLSATGSWSASEWTDAETDDSKSSTVER